MIELMAYALREYALSFGEFGEPHELPNYGGWILVRPIPGTLYRDAMGCYPLFVCRDWSRLHEDLKEIESELISLAVITDPFGTFDQSYLARCFEIVKPFKKHFIVDLRQNPESFVDRHHRYYARRSLRDMKVEICNEPIRYADAWINLYDSLIKRHKITGIRTFSNDGFRAQKQIPGLTLVIGKLGGEVIGGHIIVIHDNVAYSHLAAFSEAGYKQNASYGIYWITLKYLAEHKIRFFDLGAGAGIEENGEDGLAKFKKGWSNDRRAVYICGGIFREQKYNIICRGKNLGKTDYSPAYRQGECE